jgi:1,4-alpha-glucan branching enzyme
MLVNYHTGAAAGRTASACPWPATIARLLNSDAAIYGGSNMGNDGGVHTEAVPSHGYEQSITPTVPPLGFLLLKP